MRRASEVGDESRPELTTLSVLSMCVLLTVFLPETTHAQMMSSGSKNQPTQTSPPSLVVVPNAYRPHDMWAAQPPTDEKATDMEQEQSMRFEGKNPRSQSAEDAGPLSRAEIRSLLIPNTEWWRKWAFSVSALYEFSDLRSRVADLSSDINAAGIDLTAAINARPYTAVDFSYSYLHSSGSSPSISNDVTNEHIGAVRILQPLNNAWSCNWRPADQSDIRLNQQWATLFRASYGGSLGSLATTNFGAQHDNGYIFVGDALLDYQMAWFPCRNVPSQYMVTKEGYIRSQLRSIRDSDDYSYPNVVLELSTGPEFSTARADTSGPGSSLITSGRQIDYLSSAILSASLHCRLGLLLAVTWDAPVDSQPLHGVKPNHADTATFTGGLVYNLYPTSDKSVPQKWKRWTYSLLYSYTAFDPRYEISTVQLQASYSF